MRVRMKVDGVQYEDEVQPRTLLTHHLRDGLGRVGTPIGCDTSNCGACTVDIDGESVKSCAVLAVQADGASITTIQGLAESESGSSEGWHPVQRAFQQHHGLQCGYCTPGISSAADTSTERILACAMGLRSTVMCSSPGRVMLSVQFV